MKVRRREPETSTAALLSIYSREVRLSEFVFFFFFVGVVRHLKPALQKPILWVVNVTPAVTLRAASKSLYVTSLGGRSAQNANITNAGPAGGPT